MQGEPVIISFVKRYAKIGCDDKKIIVGLTSIPEKGKANRELIKKLAKHFKIHSSKVNIISGFKSKKKIVEVNQGE